MKNIAFYLLLLVTLQLSGQDNKTDFLAGKNYGANTYAIIVANEDYQSYGYTYVENEELAINQAERFQQYLIKKKGVPSENIRFFPDAVNTNIKLAITKLERTLPQNSNLVFYYRGKTYADTTTGELFLVPVDVSDNETFFMFGMDDLCKRLNQINRNGVDIYIDCLTGIKSGTRSILDNGFDKGNAPAGIANMELFRLKSPQIAAEPRPPVPVNARIPEIILTDPLSKIVETKESSAIIEGKVRSDCKIDVISVNGQEAHTLPDGSFMARVNLAPGENKIAVEAKNCIGWNREYVIFITPVPPPEEEQEPVEYPSIDDLKVLGKNYAIIIGISKYQDPLMPDLFYPIKDAMKVRDVLLANYTFEPKNLFFLENPTMQRITGTLDSLDKAMTPDDNLLMFYAGHGSWDEKTSMGYWMPTDAVAKSYENWLMNSIITSYVSQCKAKHTLVIADACFGGSIFRTRAFKTEEEKTDSELFSKMSKKAMTSGDLTEVPDQSVFVQNFIQYLSENREDLFTSEKLFRTIKAKVVNINDLIPQFGVIKNAGDQGGDYVFFRKQ